MVENQSSIILGYLGARVNPLARRAQKGWIRLTSDIEAGAGLGAGGRNCSDSAQNACEVLGLSDRLTGGGYLGSSVGFRVAWFDLFLHARLQLASAEDVPVTFWYTGFIGAQATILRRMRIFLGGGITGYENNADSASGMYGEGGFAVMFSKKKRPLR
jgi:hypothetical protein